MKFFLDRFFLLLVVACAFCTAFAQKQDETESASFSKAPYKIGEKLTYSVSFSNFTDAAYAELFVAGRGTYFNRDGIELRSNVQTTGAAYVLYSMNNDYVSYIDPESGKPYRTIRVARTGANPEDIARDYNQPAGDVPTPSRNIMIFGDYDFISALYRLRALPLTQNSSYRFSARYDDTQYDVELQVVGKKVVKTNVASFNAIVTQLRINKNKEADNYKIKIYFSDDERHTPVLFTAKLPAGELRAELASSELPPPTPQTPGTKESVATKPTQSANNSNNTANPANGTQQSTPDSGINPGKGNPADIRQPKADEVAPGIPRNVTNSATANPNATNPDQTNSIVAGPPSRNKNGSTTDTAKPFPKDVPFKANEQLNFGIYWQNSQLPVGKVSFQVSQRSNFGGRDGLMLSAKADSSTGAIAKLFDANDSFISFINPESLLPYRTEIKQVNNNQYNQTLTVDQDRGIINGDKGVRAEIPVGTHDLLSVAYALRSFDLTPNKPTTVSLFAGNRYVILTVTPVSRETIELGGQNVAAIQLKLTIDDPNTNADKNSSDKYALRLWVSDDSRRLPLRFSTKLPDGTLRADLFIVPAEK